MICLASNVWREAEPSRMLSPNFRLKNMYMLLSLATLIGFVCNIDYDTCSRSVIPSSLAKDFRSSIPSFSGWSKDCVFVFILTSRSSIAASFRKMPIRFFFLHIMHCEEEDKKEKIIYITIKLLNCFGLFNFYRMLGVGSSNPGHDRLKSLNMQRYAGQQVWMSRVIGGYLRFKLVIWDVFEPEILRYFYTNIALINNHISPHLSFSALTN